MFRKLLKQKTLTFMKLNNRTLCILFFLSIFCIQNVIAQGNLLISPKRIVFDGAKKTQEINLANTGKDTAKYLISVMEIRMKDDGGFEEIATPDDGQFFASKFLRFFPRTVVLAPNESQVVKVQLIKANEITEGEYRSHVYFRAIPDEKPLGEKSAAAEKDNISVQLTPVFGITIPVIIRNGESTTQISISDCALKMGAEDAPGIGLTLNRTGNMSSYGDINVQHITEDGKKTLVGEAKGVAIYTPNKSRKIYFELNKNTGANLKKGSLLVSYLPSADNKKADNKNAPYAETKVALP
jgi:P pilus assembly chaperone PapD